MARGISLGAATMTLNEGAMRFEFDTANSVTLTVAGQLNNMGTVSSLDSGSDNANPHTLVGLIYNYGTLDVQHSLIVDVDGGVLDSSNGSIFVERGETLTVDGGVINSVLQQLPRE